MLLDIHVYAHQNGCIHNIIMALLLYCCITSRMAYTAGIIRKDGFDSAACSTRWYQKKKKGIDPSLPTSLPTVQEIEQRYVGLRYASAGCIVHIICMFAYTRVSKCNAHTVVLLQ